MSGIRRRRRRRGELMAKSATLSGYTLPANSIEGTVIGNITNKIATSTLSLIDNAGGRIKLVGSAIQAGAIAATTGEYLATLKEQTATAMQLTQLRIKALGALIKGSLLFNANQQFVSIPNNNAFSQNSPFTYEGWFYPTSLTDCYLFIMLQHNWIGVFYKNGGKFGLDKSYVGTPPGYYTFNRTFPINNWYHVALTWTGAEGILYINGTPEATFTAAGSTVEDGNPLCIGTYQGQNFASFQGNVSNFRLVKGPVFYGYSSTTITGAIIQAGPSWLIPVSTAWVNSNSLVGYNVDFITNTQTLHNISISDLSASGNITYIEVLKTIAPTLNTILSVGDTVSIKVSNTFTPPTATLSAIAGTQLLLNTNNDSSFLTDSSTNNFTVTNNGNVTSSSLTPF